MLFAWICELQSCNPWSSLMWSEVVTKTDLSAAKRTWRQLLLQSSPLFVITETKTLVFANVCLALLTSSELCLNSMKPCDNEFKHSMRSKIQAKPLCVLRWSRFLWSQRSLRRVLGTCYIWLCVRRGNRVRDYANLDCCIVFFWVPSYTSNVPQWLWVCNLSTVCVALKLLA